VHLAKLWIEDTLSAEVDVIDPWSHSVAQTLKLHVDVPPAFRVVPSRPLLRVTDRDPSPALTFFVVTPEPVPDLALEPDRSAGFPLAVERAKARDAGRRIGFRVRYTGAVPATTKQYAFSARSGSRPDVLGTVQVRVTGASGDEK
jgi:hypothetical protein